MRTTFYILLLITSSLIFNNCKKDQSPIPANNDSIPTPLDTTHNNTPTYDTIFPGSYYPIYPGSQWTYLKNDSVIFHKYASSTYLPHSYLTDNFNNYSDTVYVPFLDGNPIYGYQFIEHSPSIYGDYYVKWPIISETVGYTYERGWTDHRFGDLDEHLRVIEKTTDINGDSIIVVGGYWTYFSMGPDSSVQIYKKNVGLTYYVIFNKLTLDTVYKQVLIDYNINN